MSLNTLYKISRVISESVAGIETLLNQAYERNAVLESELEEVENLRMKLQRASDETRGHILLLLFFIGTITLFDNVDLTGCFTPAEIHLFHSFLKRYTEFYEFSILRQFFPSLNQLKLYLTHLG